MICRRQYSDPDKDGWNISYKSFPKIYTQTYGQIVYRPNVLYKQYILECREWK